MSKLNSSASLKAVLPLVPLGFARSALFGVGSDRHVPDLQSVALAISPVRGAQLKYTGPKLNQHHSLTWQAVIQSAIQQGFDADHPFEVAAADLLRAMGGRGDDSKQRERLWGWLKELQRTQIEYRSDTHDYVGPLIFEATRQKPSGRMVVRLNEKMFRLLGDEVLKNDLTRKAALGRNQLALWLHDYIATHKHPPAESLDTLRKRCGSSLLLPQFRSRLRAAMTLLSRGEDPLILDWRIDRQDKLICKKTETPVLIKPPPVAETNRAGMRAKDRHLEECKRAGEQRANVAL